MDRDVSPADPQGELVLDDGEPARVARYIALEREKEELRRERDHVMLQLAGQLGPAELARRFGVEPPVITKLLDGARGRLNSVAADGDHVGGEISARRLRAGEPRWVVADAHFEALGRTPA